MLTGATAILKWINGFSNSISNNVNENIFSNNSIQPSIVARTEVDQISREILGLAAKGVESEVQKNANVNLNGC
ncbi:MAG: hypothetical protein MZU97_09145 [Bacillus subtilis]|nr:hypothetical protein [Bacillus subtilis]